MTEPDKRAALEDMAEKFLGTLVTMRDNLNRWARQVDDCVQALRKAVESK